jgi:hypothetical protein
MNLSKWAIALRDLSSNCHLKIIWLIIPRAMDERVKAKKKALKRYKEGLKC